MVRGLQNKGRREMHPQECTERLLLIATTVASKRTRMCVCEAAWQLEICLRYSKHPHANAMQTPSHVTAKRPISRVSASKRHLPDYPYSPTRTCDTAVRVVQNLYRPTRLNHIGALQLSVSGRLNDVQVDTVHTGPKQRLLFPG